MAGKNVKMDFFCKFSKEFVQKSVQKTSKEQENLNLIGILIASVQIVALMWNMETVQT